MGKCKLKQKAKINGNLEQTYSGYTVIKLGHKIWHLNLWKPKE